MKFLRKIFSRKREYLIYGEQGGINSLITLPKGFKIEKDHCPMVVLMHGFMSSMNRNPLPQIAEALADAGIGTIRFDFNAHGKSEGNFIDMTLANEVSDARAVLRYVSALPYVTKVGILGHSQGGVISGLLSGELEDDALRPACVALLAPAAVLKDDAIAGTCMGVKYDAANPPEYVNIFFHKLGRKFILAAQKLPLYEISCQYTGPVCIIHGKNDKIVPYSYAEEYNKRYTNSDLHILEDEGHFMRKQLAEITKIVIEFMGRNLGLLH